ncbi:hypothetical protein GJ496_004918, partial [Pomphorhynchus laevis]
QIQLHVFTIQNSFSEVCICTNLFGDVFLSITDTISNYHKFLPINIESRLHNWTHLLISIFDNKTCKLFVNGNIALNHELNRSFNPRGKKIKIYFGQRSRVVKSAHKLQLASFVLLNGNTKIKNPGRLPDHIIQHNGELLNVAYRNFR